MNTRQNMSPKLTEVLVTLRSCIKVQPGCVCSQEKTSSQYPEATPRHVVFRFQSEGCCPQSGSLGLYGGRLQCELLATGA